MAKQRSVTLSFEPALTPPGRIALSRTAGRCSASAICAGAGWQAPIENIEGMFRRVAKAVAEPDGATAMTCSPPKTRSTRCSPTPLLPELAHLHRRGDTAGPASLRVRPAHLRHSRKASDGIFQTLRDAALIQQTGGGNGFSSRTCAPKRTPWPPALASLPVRLDSCAVYDIAFGEVAQGGTRRGGQHGPCCRGGSPGYRGLRHVQAQEGQISNFNISVGITDAFMQACGGGRRLPVDQPARWLGLAHRARRDLFDKVVTYAHSQRRARRAVPGRGRTAPTRCRICMSSKPRTPAGTVAWALRELLPRLINLAQHWTADGRVDWAKLEESTVVSTRFLDNVVDANKYVPAVPSFASGAAQPAHRAGHHGPGRPDVSPGRALRLARWARSSPLSHGVHPIPRRCAPASRWRRSAARSRHQGQHLYGTRKNPSSRAPPEPLYPCRHDWGRPALDWGEIVEASEARHPQPRRRPPSRPRAPSHREPLRGLRLRAGVRAGYTAHVKDGDRRPEAHLHQPAFEAALASGRRA